MTTDNTTTATPASERPEVPAEVLVAIETVSGRVRAIRDVVEDWALTHYRLSPDDNLMPDADGELWAANAALSIASELLRLYTRTDGAWRGFSIGRAMTVEPQPRPAVSWELVREPLHDAAHRVSSIMEEARGVYQERTGDGVGLPESWVELHQVHVAMGLALSILALYEDRRTTFTPETGGS